MTVKKVDGTYACDAAYLVAMSLMKGKTPKCIKQPIASRGTTCEPMAIFTLKEITSTGNYQTGCKNIAGVCAKAQATLRKVLAEYRFEQVKLKIAADRL